MLVVCGSTNPTKVGATQTIFDRLRGEPSWVELLDVVRPQDVDKLQVQSLAANSGVSEQPTGEEETRRGAAGRCADVLAQTPADLAVGMEGGVVRRGGDWFVMAWCVVQTRAGLRAAARGVELALPRVIGDCLEQGEELGPVIDRLLGYQDSKLRHGAIGVLTRGLFDRQSSWELSLACALAPLMSPSLYGLDQVQAPDL